MKKLLLLVFGICFYFCSFIICANADDVYYTNSNNVSMTKEEYDFFSEMYWDGYQEYITEALYNKFHTYGYFNGTIEKVEYDENLNKNIINSEPSRGLIHETTAKKLTMSKSCYGNFCFVDITLQWKGDPNIKSYDVIGALLYGNITLLTEPDTVLHYSGGNLFYGDEYYVGDGFGTSVKLQNSSSNMIISQSYDLSGSGTLYASYQHATKNITKATSQKYTVGFGGYGGVFHFYGAAVGKFDQMGGVYATVSTS